MQFNNNNSHQKTVPNTGTGNKQTNNEDGKQPKSEKKSDRNGSAKKLRGKYGKDKGEKQSPHKLADNASFVENWDKDPWFTPKTGKERFTSAPNVDNPTEEGPIWLQDLNKRKSAIANIINDVRDVKELHEKLKDDQAIKYQLAGLSNSLLFIGDKKDGQLEKEKVVTKFAENLSNHIEKEFGKKLTKKNLLLLINGLATDVIDDNVGYLFQHLYNKNFPDTQKGLGSKG